MANKDFHQSNKSVGIDMQELLNKLDNYGIVQVCAEIEGMLHITITDIDTNAQKTWKCCREVLDMVGKEFPIVHKFVTDSTVFDLILKPKQR